MSPTQPKTNHLSESIKIGILTYLQIFNPVLIVYGVFGFYFLIGLGVIIPPVCSILWIFLLNKSYKTTDSNHIVVTIFNSVCAILTIYFSSKFLQAADYTPLVIAFYIDAILALLQLVYPIIFRLKRLY